MYSTIALSLLATLATAAPTTPIEAANIANNILARAPVGSNPNLKSVTTSGSGCAANSAYFAYLDNATAAFDSLIVDNTVPANMHKACLVTIDLELDPAWKYTINKWSTMRGWTDGAWASFQAVYTAGGSSSTVTAEIEQGEGNVAVQKQGGATSGYGGGVSTIDISVTLKSGGTGGYFAVDSLDIGFDYSQ